jgi:hypothetical protein
MKSCLAVRSCQQLSNTYSSITKEVVVTKYAVYLPTVVLLLTTLANAVTPAITLFWANHASAAAIIAPLAVVVAHWLPSPYGGDAPNR